MKIINVSDKPYEWTWDAKNFGPLAPGQVGDYPAEIAHHAIKRSAVINDEGNNEGYRVKALEAMKADKKALEQIITYACPFVEMGMCEEQERFKTKDDLKAHLELVHFGAPAPMAGRSDRVRA